MNLRSPPAQNRTNCQTLLKIGNSQTYIDHAREGLNVFYEQISEYLGWGTGEPLNEDSRLREYFRDAYSRLSQFLGWERDISPPSGLESGEPDLFLHEVCPHNEGLILEESTGSETKNCNSKEIQHDNQNNDESSSEEFHFVGREDDISESLHKIILQLEAYPIATSILDDVISTAFFVAEQAIRTTSAPNSDLSDARLEASIIVAQLVQDLVKLKINSDLYVGHQPMIASEILVDGPTIEEIIQSRQQSPSASIPTLDRTVIYPSLCSIAEYTNEEPRPRSAQSIVCPVCSQNQKTVHFHEDLNRTYMIPIQSGHNLTPLPKKESSQVNISNKARAKEEKIREEKNKEEKKKQPKPEKEHKSEKHK